MTLLAGCTKIGSTNLPSTSTMPVTGVTVTLNGEPQQLVAPPITVGNKLPSSQLTNSITLEKIDLSELKGKVMILSIVPSLMNSSQIKGKILYSKISPSLETETSDTQTKLLWENSKDLPPNILTFTISEDPKFIQKKFASHNNFDGISYLSDYKYNYFGKSTGLQIQGQKYMARCIIVTDKDGIIRHIDISPELTQLPDIKKAIAIAIKLANNNT
jgi:thioredoxin-dependent peroxiredoxin